MGPSRVCVLDWGLRQHLGAGGVGPGVGVCGPAGAGGGGVVPGPLWARLCCSACAAHPACSLACSQGAWSCMRPCWDRDMESCVGNGAEALAASTGTLGSYGKGPSLSCTKALSLGRVSGWKQRGPLVQECGDRSRIPTQWVDRSLPWPLPIDFAVNLEQQ